MAETIETYLEVGAKRVFAGAVQWPGWCRSGRDEDAALAALAQYAERYGSAVAAAGTSFSPPDDATAFSVVERIPGNGGTDFGVPGVPGAVDERPVDAADSERLLALLQSCWATFDAAAAAHAGAELRKGPRGGGRELDGIVDHVLGADGSYLHSLGGRWKRDEEADPLAEMARVRNGIVEVWNLRVNGEPPPRTPRAGAKLWSPRYFVRRSAWHALDHAWEIEDRVT